MVCHMVDRLVHIERPSLSCRFCRLRSGVSLEIQEFQVVSSLIPFITVVIDSRTWLSFKFSVSGKSLSCTEMKIVGEFIA